MKVNDVVTVITGCKDCGNLRAKILWIDDESAIVRVMDSLPHHIRYSEFVVPVKKLRMDSK